ncbi:cupin domain-containing protein [Aureimonas leprariae]|uniref:Cupin domain-containing protein n=1 Tax=Plantimonas leprariae TaxID=2615207 RepID=A0A7V7PRB9_9HYPH|nr:cupin domain-containing protein [Aureimonas leprariae]KAB0681232.1 cupin domain-containing protein [Aureimonas leprariae]
MTDRTEPEAKPGLAVVRAAKRIRGKQGPVYEQGVSAELVGAKAIHLQTLTIPPGAIERAHKHADHETAIFIVGGTSRVWWGDELEHHEEARAGSFVYIAAGVPHMPYNPSETEPCTVVIARTDANEQESVILLPELEERWKAREDGPGRGR